MFYKVYSLVKIHHMIILFGIVQIKKFIVSHCQPTILTLLILF